MEQALTFNCPHVGIDRWGCGAEAGSECNWEHDDATTHERFHAERIMQVTGLEGFRVPKEIIERAAIDLIG